MAITNLSLPREGDSYAEPKPAARQRLIDHGQGYIVDAVESGRYDPYTYTHGVICQMARAAKADIEAHGIYRDETALSTLRHIGDIEEYIFDYVKQRRGVIRQ